MKEAFYLLFHLFTTLAKLIRPGGNRTVIAENLLLKQQLIIHSRSRQRAPNLTTRDRALLGLVDELHDGATLSAPRWRALREHFDEAQLVELVVLTGFYHTISFLTNAFELELEPFGARFPAA